MKDPVHSEGILLHAIPYLGRKKILKVFTKNAGLITLLHHPSSSNLSSLIAPFCLAEWIYRKGRLDLHTCSEVSLIDPLLGLRKTLEHIQAASSIAKTLLSSQWPEKPAAELYTLLKVYLQRLPHFSHPQILSLSFRLKYLWHEGILALQESCSTCTAPARHLSQGQSYCSLHAPPSSLGFSSQEWETLHHLTFTRSLTTLQQIHQAPKEKIDQLFELIL